MQRPGPGTRGGRRGGGPGRRGRPHPARHGGGRPYRGGRPPRPAQPPGRPGAVSGRRGRLRGVDGGSAGRPTVVAPLAGAVVEGVLDDRFDLPAWLRLLGQGAVGVGVAVVVTTRVPGIGGGVLVTAVTVLLMNGSISRRAARVPASASSPRPRSASALLLDHGARDLSVALAAALVGFLWYNRPPARVYLGDGELPTSSGPPWPPLVAWAWSQGRALPAGCGRASCSWRSRWPRSPSPSCAACSSTLNRSPSATVDHPYDLPWPGGGPPHRSAELRWCGLGVLVTAAVLAGRRNVFALLVPWP